MSPANLQNHLFSQENTIFYDQYYTKSKQICFFTTVFSDDKKAKIFTKSKDTVKKKK